MRVFESVDPGYQVQACWCEAIKAEVDCWSELMKRWDSSCQFFWEEMVDRTPPRHSSAPHQSSPVKPSDSPHESTYKFAVRFYRKGPPHCTAPSISPNPSRFEFIFFAFIVIIAVFSPVLLIRITRSCSWWSSCTVWISFENRHMMYASVVRFYFSFTFFPV